MKIRKPIVLSKILILGFVIFQFSCKGEEQEDLLISEVPEIFFKDIEFHKRTLATPDTIALTITFKDGDMNLGLTGSEIDSPYHAYNYFYLEGNSVKKTSSISHPNLMKLGDSDSLPPYIPPYICRNYRIKNVGDEVNTQYDTLYVEPNLGYRNILVEIYYEEDGQFIMSEYFNAFTKNAAGHCTEGLNGRFPVIDNARTGIIVNGPETPFIISLKNRFEGELRYNMTSHGFSHVFKGKNIKLRVQILDRDLNQSNWVETPPLAVE